MTIETFNLTEKQINRYTVIDAFIKGFKTAAEAAEDLGLSMRQIFRLKNKVLDEGVSGLIHGNTDRKPTHATLEKTEKLIIELKQKKYERANFKHFQELLDEHENIKVSYSTVYRILTRAGFKSPKKKRKRKTHHRRQRRGQKGDLVQIDASPHEWIFDGSSFDLHGAIDDATGEILALYFTPNECMEGYFEIVRQIVENHGIPLNFYSDRHTIFRSPKADKISIEDQLQGKKVNLTQFGRAMDELGINMIPAYSPQAKGRVEKLWDTLQSRLPVEFDIKNITTIEKANAFLPEFIEKFNKKFGVKPRCNKSVFRQLNPGLTLDYILCKKEERTIINNSGFSYGGTYYQLTKNGKKASSIPKTKINVLTSSRIGIKADYDGIVYDTVVLDERPKKSVVKQSKREVNQKYKPSENHPWKQECRKKSMSLYEKALLSREDDFQIKEIIDDLFNSTRAWI